MGYEKDWEINDLYTFLLQKGLLVEYKKWKEELVKND